MRKDFRTGAYNIFSEWLSSRSAQPELPWEFRMLSSRLRCTQTNGGMRPGAPPAAQGAGNEI